MARDRTAVRRGPGRAALQGLVDAGRLPQQPVTPLAHVLVGALEEAALDARAPDPEPSTEEVRAALVALVDGVLVDEASGPA